MKIATKTGDRGKTSLLLGQNRVLKSHPLIDLVGEVDELCAAMGMARSICPNKTADGKELDYYYDRIGEIQQLLVFLMGEISCEKDMRNEYIKKYDFITVYHLNQLDEDVDFLQNIKEIVPTDWVIYGETDLGGRLDFASKVCRRMERKLIQLNEVETFRSVILQYVNRLSDYLYLVARYADYMLQK